MVIPVSDLIMIDFIQVMYRKTRLNWILDKNMLVKYCYQCLEDWMEWSNGFVCPESIFFHFYQGGQLMDGGGNCSARRKTQTFGNCTDILSQTRIYLDFCSKVAWGNGILIVPTVRGTVVILCIRYTSTHPTFINYIPSKQS